MAGFLPNYFNSLASDTAKRRYMDKLKLAEGADPYEVPKNEWKDDIDLWPAITHVHVCVYLILTPSPILTRICSTTRVWTPIRALSKVG